MCLEWPVGRLRAYLRTGEAIYANAAGGRRVPVAAGVINTLVIELASPTYLEPRVMLL